MNHIDNQGKIRYLRGYRLNELEIVRLEEELQRWRSQAERVTAIAVLHGTSGKDNRLQMAIDRMSSTVDILAAQLAGRVRRRQSIEATINNVADERLRLLLRYRYIDGLTWERIAVEMNYVYRQVTRLHGHAIEQIPKDVLECPT